MQEPCYFNLYFLKPAADIFSGDSQGAVLGWNQTRSGIFSLTFHLKVVP